MLASVDRPEEIEDARVAGYASAVVVPEFRSDKAFSVSGTTARLIRCPAETTDGGVTCVECRLCLDRDLLKLNDAIAFKVHGPARRKRRTRSSSSGGKSRGPRSDDVRSGSWRAPSSAGPASRG